MTVAKRRPLVLGAGAALLLFLGLIYAYSVLLAPLKGAFGWDVASMTLVFALSIISFTVGGIVSGELVRRGWERRGLALGAVLLAVGFLGTSAVAGASSLVAVCAAYGVAASVGIGVVYNVVIPTVTSWFPDRVGLAQGVCLMGFGSGGFVLGPVVTRLYALLDWRAVLVGSGAALAALVLATAAVMRPPRGEELRVIRALPVRSPLPLPAGGPPAERGAGAAAMLRDRTFYLLYAFLFLLGCIGMGVTGIGRELPLSLGASDLTAALVIGCVNVGSGLGRLGGGAALDRLGRSRTMRGVGALGLVGPVAMALSLVAGSLAVQAVACLITGVGWGAAVVSMPFVTRTRWGQGSMARNMALVNTYSVFASLAGSWGTGLLSAAAGSYVPALLVMALMGAASVAVARAL